MKFSQASLLLLALLLALVLQQYYCASAGHCNRCTRRYRPVCASGRTFRNACLARCSGSVNFVRGRCLCLCPPGSNPVCSSSSGRTYRNACYAKCAGATETTPGRCSDSGKTGCASCSNWLRPVCANGKTYRNFCHALCRGVKSYHHGAC
ncbi:hypothetical protein BOX15_Mlig007587g1 [Macrostomum lignano]|uniref:Kazal-like domain-containing protein n=1 Tax=Macrostomum lignano TaxID=282301 RepID=A0A267F551_9PLAT|nr:hypothetical protein BOX15_Mlig007587g2 [Macrostomum lignano]PAA68152.1 hypothetical protein BOX15_Mlig007587g1 [Macrostomum lignano]